MNEKIPVHNNTAMPMYVGAAMIPPGETRHFDVDHVPPELRPVKAAPIVEPPPDDLAVLLESNVKDIVALLPAASDADLERLGDLEQAKGDAARKTLLAAIAEENLRRADAKTAAGAGGADDPAAGKDNEGA